MYCVCFHCELLRRGEKHFGKGDADYIRTVGGWRKLVILA